jgi:acyl dehydratase
MIQPSGMRGQTLVAVGNRWRTGERVLDRAEMVAFARVWDPLPVHTDPASSQVQRFGDVIASGLYTLAVYQSLVSREVLHDQPIIAARALERVGFARPAFPGDVVHAEVEVTDAVLGAGGTVEVELTGSLIRDRKRLLEVRVALVVSADGDGGAGEWRDDE